MLGLQDVVGRDSALTNCLLRSFLPGRPIWTVDMGADMVGTRAEVTRPASLRPILAQLLHH